MYSIALKMLMGDRAKFIILVIALAFSSLLMTQQGALFIGMLRWTTSTLLQFQVPIWVVNPRVEQLNETQPMRDIDLERVRSVSGVAWAVPLNLSVQWAKLPSGFFKPIFLLGLDSTTLLGAPSNLIEGKVNYLRQANAVIVDTLAIKQLSENPEHPIGMGSTFEVNDHEARIVGIANPVYSYWGYPYIYTTYERALEMIPPQRKNLGYILVHQQEGLDAGDIARRIEQETGLRAYTDNEFFWSTIIWFFKYTDIPGVFGITIMLGLIVGTSISGQTFYLFVLENIRYLGVLKAMGAGTNLLAKMLFVQAFFVGFIGFGLGVGLSCFLAITSLLTGAPPYYLTFDLLFGIGIVILIICCFAALIAIRKVSKLEAAEVFRG